MTGLLRYIYLTVTDAAGCESYAGPYEILNEGGSAMQDLLYENAVCEQPNGIISITGSTLSGEIWYSVDSGYSWQSDSLF